MQLSRKIQRLSASETIAITARAKQLQAAGQDVISFAAGEPDFDTPQFIKDAAIAALLAGDTKYTPRQGEQLKAAISEKLAHENQVHIDASQIVVTFGTKHALYAACQAAIEPGQKVLIPSPYWVSYPEMVRLAGGECVFMPTAAEHDYKITPEQLDQFADQSGAKLLILNSPNNPAGSTYSPTELAELAKVIVRRQIVCFSDEIYEKLIYGETRFVSLASLEEEVPGIADLTVTFNGVAKAFAMTGWRIGWAAGPSDLIGGIRKLMSHETTNPAGFAQTAALAAYTNPQAAQSVETMRKEFERRARLMFKRLNAIDGVSCPEPTGAFYCFANVAAHYGRTLGGQKVNDSAGFAKAALEAAQIAMVPGAPLGDDRCVRLSFATSMANVEQGLDRLERLLA